MRRNEQNCVTSHDASNCAKIYECAECIDKQPMHYFVYRLSNEDKDDGAVAD
jgi:hypothetical protein